MWRSLQAAGSRLVSTRRAETNPRTAGCTRARDRDGSVPVVNSRSAGREESRPSRQECLRHVLLALLLAVCLHAKRLPIRSYTTADGLASDQVLCIHQDSHGFLWFCTAEGLSRFDGYSFTNYHTGDGLPGNRVRKIIETRQGI